jgi:hypothetical protein
MHARAFKDHLQDTQVAESSQRHAAYRRLIASSVQADFNDMNDVRIHEGLDLRYDSQSTHRLAEAA